MNSIDENDEELNDEKDDWVEDYYERTRDDDVDDLEPQLKINDNYGEKRVSNLYGKRICPSDQDKELYTVERNIYGEIKKGKVKQ